MAILLLFLPPRSAMEKSLERGQAKKQAAIPALGRPILPNAKAVLCFPNRRFYLVKYIIFEKAP